MRELRQQSQLLIAISVSQFCCCLRARSWGSWGHLWSKHAMYWDNWFVQKSRLSVLQRHRFKTWNSKCHLHSQVLVYSDLQKCLWKAHLSSSIMEQIKKWYLPKLEVSKVHDLYACASAGRMHTPKALWLKPSCPAASRKAHALCWVQKWRHVLATCFLLTAETENTRGLDGDLRKMQDIKCPLNTSNILLLPRNFSNFQCTPLCTFAAVRPLQQHLIQLHKGQGE